MLNYTISDRSYAGYERYVIARISYWLQRRAELRDPSKPITVKAAPKMPAGQTDMFSDEEAA